MKLTDKHIMKNIIYRIILLFLLFHSSPCVNANKISHYHKWINLSSETLLQRGGKFMIDNKVDSALVCFTIVNNRYQKDMTYAEKLLCCEAEYGKWYIYFAKMFDYTKAYECLLNANEIIEENEIDYPELKLCFAVFYHTLAGHSYDEVLEKKAYEYCKDGFWAAYEQKDFRLLDIFFCNIMLVAETLNTTQSLGKEWDVYNKIKRKGVFNYDFNILQYNARLNKSNGNYEKAHSYCDKLIELSDKNEEDMRRSDIARLLKARIFFEQNDYPSAIKVLHEDENRMKGEDFRDCRLEIYNFLTKCYNKLGDTTNSNKFGNHYYQLKDSIINLKQMTNVNKMSFMNEIKKMDNEINEMRYKRNSQIVFVILSSVFSFVLLIFVALLFNKNRQLKSKNRKLYERNIEMMNSEDMEIKTITSNASDNTESEPAVPKEDTEGNGEDVEVYENYDENYDNDAEKYKNSSLSIEDKNELLAKILNVMENIEEICSISFSAERLAQLTGSKYKYVSQVINEKYGCNFNMFLNKFRIKEACRRFSDVENYGQYTIDAMSQSLGFKSRTTFTSSFKKIIGLTPSQYSKLAKEDKEKARIS